MEVNMKDISLKDLAKRMRNIDIAMLSTHTESGQIASRPMSNNRDVDYDGDSYYFTWEGARMVKDIKKNPKVSLGFQAGMGFYAAVEGEAELVTDEKTMAMHWDEDLNHWFKEGPKTEGVTMIKVKAKRISYWDGMSAGTVKI